jgi:hypothetical protein
VQWAENSKLYYSNGARMMEAVISTSPDFRVVSRRQLFEFQNVALEQFYRTWDLAPDGSHFLVARAVQSAGPPKIVVIHNWAAEVRARMAAN